MRRLALLGAALSLVVALAVAQLVLPGIAARRIRSQLSSAGRVRSVSVQAFPALTLLWHHADGATIALSSYDADVGGLSRSLDQLWDVGSLHASSETVTVGRLTVHDARLVKRGDALTGSATVTDAELRDVLPILSSVTPVASAGGVLTLRGTATVLGIPVAVDADVGALDGALVVTPDVPFGGLATVTVFSDPDVRITGVSATAIDGAFVLHATAQLR